MWVAKTDDNADASDTTFTYNAGLGMNAGERTRKAFVKDVYAFYRVGQTTLVKRTPEEKPKLWVMFVS